MASQPRHPLERLVTVGACAALLGFAGFLVVSMALGWRLQVVRTGSMAPTYPVGALTVVTPADPASLVPGRSVVFVSPSGSGQLVSHRVVRRVERPDGLFLETRGDANPAADPYLVSARSVRGTVRWSVPRLGSALAALAQPWVALLLVVIPLGVLAEGQLRTRSERLAPLRDSSRVS